MTQEQYDKIKPQIPAINLFFNEKQWQGDISVLDEVAKSMGRSTNLGCNQCKAELVNWMYHRIKEHENGNS